MIYEKNNTALVPHRIAGTKINWVEGDVLNIAKRIRDEVSEDLALGWNQRLNRYEIKYDNKHGRRVLVKTIDPEKGLGDWIIQDLKFADAANGNLTWEKYVALEEQAEREEEAKQQQFWDEAKERTERELAYRGITHAPKLSMFRPKKEWRPTKVK